MSLTMCSVQGIQKSYPLYNKVTEIMVGTAMSGGFRASRTNSTLVALHIITASQFNSLNWQKNNVAKKNRKNIFFFHQFSGLKWLMNGPDKRGLLQGREQPLPENVDTAFSNSRMLFQPFGGISPCPFLPSHQRWGAMQAV